jgi:hypothetical protein
MCTYVMYMYVCVYNLQRVILGFGNDLLQLSDTDDFEGDKNIGESILNFLRHFS